VDAWTKALSDRKPPPKPAASATVACCQPHRPRIPEARPKQRDFRRVVVSTVNPIGTATFCSSEPGLPPIDRTATPEKGSAPVANNSDGRGQVKDPEHDGRLKQNRDEGVRIEGGGDDTESNGQGRVKNPETDGRLKQNRDGGSDVAEIDEDEEVQSGGQGRVKDPEHDGRLKQNRD